MNCVLVTLALFVGLASTLEDCTIPTGTIPHQWRDLHHECYEKLKGQIKEELRASLTYLAMGAHFGRDNVNRPGLSKFFLDSSHEEREHAQKIIDYILMRGRKLPDHVVPTLVPTKLFWESGEEALKDALELEAKVTGMIKEIVRVCEGNFEGGEEKNDYHLVDYLSDEFLGEQHRSSRDLAGKLVTLKKMYAQHGSLAEFIFDHHLANSQA